MESDDRRIRLVLNGARTSEGAIEFDALLAFGDGFRKALRAIVRSRSGLRAMQPGQPATDVREATSFRLVGISKGSAVLELEPVEPRLLADPTVEAVQALVDGLDQKQPLDAAAVEALRGALQSLGDGGSIGIRVANRNPITVDEHRLDALMPQGVPLVDEASFGTVDGWLHAVDIDPDEVRIRDASGREWSCHYSPSLEASIGSLLGRTVRVAGVMRPAGARPRIEVESLASLGPPTGVSSSSDRSPDELLARAMAAANLVGPQSLADLSVDVDVADPEEAVFEEALKAIR